MHPGRIADHEVMYVEPKDWNKAVHGPCWPLYAKRIYKGGNQLLKTAWFPTMLEIEALKRGAPAYLTLWGRKHPPVKLEVGNSVDEMSPMPRAINVERSAAGNRCVNIVFNRPPTDDEIAILRDHLT